MRQFNKSRCAALVIALGLLVNIAAAVPWMYDPTSQPGSLGNNYCEFQNYGGAPYYHDGIDVMQNTGGIPVYSVSDGWMTHETAGTMYGGLMIGDQYVAGATGWLYWHLPNSTYPFNVGDRIYTGDYIGDIAYWSVSNFHHTHFNRVTGTSGLPWGWYISIENPLELLVPDTDLQPPLVHDAVGTDLLAFCNNNTSTYLSPLSLRGDVDIIAKLGDKFYNNTWEIIPYRIEYTISSPAIVDHHLAFVFDDLLPASTTVSTVFKDDATCNSEGNYTYRNFFFILTNNDGDNTIEVNDNAGTWHTAGYPAGTYTVTVQAYDEYGNLTQDSMDVNVLATTTYDISVTLTPTSSLALPASGGTINYTAEVHNNGTTTAIFDAWIIMTYPSGSTSLMLLRTLSLPGGGTVLRNLSQTIAGSEPNGNYSYDGYVGYYPYNDWATSGFTFTKGLDFNGAGSWMDQTNLSGWEETPEADYPVASETSQDFDLVKAYPNPCNPTATLSFALPEASQTSLKVYDLAGREVATLVNGWKTAGNYQVVFDAANLPSGLYVYRLQAGSFSSTGKIMLMK